MAKYYVTHSCGHDEMVELFGPGKDRDRRIAQLESHECPKCRAKHATEHDVSMGLSPLSGSPKQIAWASDIRMDMFSTLGDLARKMIRQLKKLEGDPDYTAEDLSEMAQEGDRNILTVYNGLCNETSAKWLIENRGSEAAMVKRYL